MSLLASPAKGASVVGSSFPHMNGCHTMALLRAAFVLACVHAHVVCAVFAGLRCAALLVVHRHVMCDAWRDAPHAVREQWRSQGRRPKACFEAGTPGTFSGGSRRSWGRESQQGSDLAGPSGGPGHARPASPGGRVAGPVRPPPVRPESRSAAVALRVVEGVAGWSAISQPIDVSDRRLRVRALRHRGSGQDVVARPSARMLGYHVHGADWAMIMSDSGVYVEYLDAGVNRDVREVRRAPRRCALPQGFATARVYDFGSLTPTERLGSAPGDKPAKGEGGEKGGWEEVSSTRPPPADCEHPFVRQPPPVSAMTTTAGRLMSREVLPLPLPALPRPFGLGLSRAIRRHEGQRHWCEWFCEGVQLLNEPYGSADSSP